MNLRQELKAFSKSQLNRNGNWKLPALVAGVSILLSAYSQNQMDQNSIASWILSLFVGIISIYSSMLYLNIAKLGETESIRFEDMKVEPKKLLKCILYSLIISLVTFGITFAFVIFSGLITTLVPFLGIFLVLATSFVGIVISIYATFSVLLILDKNSSVLEALKISVMLVKGNFWKIIILGLSFIPWIIVVGLTFGIGAIWVMPYIGITFANYYLYLYQEKIGDK